MEESDEEPGERKVVTRRTPREPTKEERIAHSATHTPYRSWCEECVAGRGKSHPHHQGESEEKGMPSVHIDYWFMRDQKGADLIPVATMVEEETKIHKAHIVPMKGNIDYVATQINKDIESLGHAGPVIVKGDQEPALQDLAKAVKKRNKEGIILETSRARDSQSNGRAERAVQAIEGITRTMKLALEKRIRTKIPCGHPVMTWMVEHGAETINRFHVSKDGRTPYERLKGKRFKGEVVEFGRKIMYRYPGKPEGGSMQRRWEEGIWLGKKANSDEHIVWLCSGALVKTNSITLKTEAESWDAKDVLDVKAVPWALKGEGAGDGEQEVHDETGRPAIVPSQEPANMDANVDLGEVEPDLGVVPRDVNIRPEQLAKYGYSDLKKHGIRCQKCVGMQRHDPSATRRAHSQACRERLKKCMGEDERYAERMKEAEDRRGEYISRKIEREEAAREGKRPKVRIEEGTTTSSSSSSTHVEAAVGIENIDQDMEGITRKRGRVAEEDVEEQERPGRYQMTEDDEGDTKMAGTDMNHVYKLKPRGGREIDDEHEDEKEMKRRMKNEDRRARGKYEVVEIFSPPRVCARARERGKNGGWSLDWMVMDPITRQTWDLRQDHVKRKVLGMLRRDRPELVVACPPCTLFSMLQNLSGDPRTRCPVKWKEAVDMVDFAVEVCLEQLKAGRHFVFEHPLSATSWRVTRLDELRKTKGVHEATGHMCAYGMRARDLYGEAPVMKPTRYLTSSRSIQEKLCRRCEGGHRHVQLVSGRAAKAAVYPQELVDAILDGMEVETMGSLYNLMDVGKTLNIDGVHEAEDIDWKFIDDLTGLELDRRKVMKARLEEMSTFERMQVYECVPREVAKMSQTGKFVGVRWVDALKGVDVRSRLVAQEFAGREVRDDLFAGTPPLMATRAIISDVATNPGSGRWRRKLIVLDIKRAFLYGDIEEEIYIELPDEDPRKQQGMVGKLKKAMYGTRAAPQVWQATVKKVMRKLGFEACRVMPGVFYHQDRDLRIVTHVDDFLGAGCEENLRWFKKELAKEFELKSAILGDGNAEEKSITFLGRQIEWTDDGITYAADPKHAEILLREWDMSDSKAVGSPGVPDEREGKGEDVDGDEEMAKDEGTKYRRAVARLNYMGQDRFDIGYAAKDLSKLCRRRGRKT